MSDIDGFVVECWGDDVPDGQATDFRRAVKAKQDEVVVLSWIEHFSKEIRDAANEKAMADRRGVGADGALHSGPGGLVDLRGESGPEHRDDRGRRQDVDFVPGNRRTQRCCVTASAGPALLDLGLDLG